jgi:hypothetical protein
LLNFSAPTSSPIVTAPTFEDWARIRPTLIVSVPRSSASSIVRSATWMLGASVNSVVGVTSFSSSAAETVNALKVEPGS